MKILVTGGAGFIGSHLIDRLLDEKHNVTCIDDLSLGKKEHIKHNLANPDFKFIKEDLLNFGKLSGIFKSARFDCVFHLAANSDIQLGNQIHRIDLDKNFLTTFNILECMSASNTSQLVFASTSAIYGESDKKLAEDYGPLLPISFYGASKLAAEAYISVYSNNYGIKSWIFRFPNVVGERATHGAIFDFINKLRKNPKKLEVLGDGNQRKPYMYVRDLIDGILFGQKKSNEVINYFNLGCSSNTSVSEIVKIVTHEMELEGVKIEYSGGDRGWIGDVPYFLYDLSKINNLGWKAKYNSTEAVRLAIRKMLKK